MKILFVSKKYPPYIGGTQTQLQLLAQELAETNSVRVAILSNGLERHGVLQRWLLRIASLCKLNTNVIEILGIVDNNYFDKKVRVGTIHLSLIDRLAIFISLGALVNKIMEKNIARLMKDFDVVHCVKPDLSLAVNKAAAKLNIPFAIAPYIHGQSIRRELKVILQEADLIFALSETDRENLIKLGIQSNKISLMGVAPLISFNGSGESFRSRHDLKNDPVVLFIGRMIEYKGAKALLNATELVWQVNPNARFVFIGPSTDRSSFWFTQYSDKRISYLGAVSEQEKANALAACDIFCMPSEYEILPAVYLEAWFYRKPVIGGTAHGLKELIDGNEAGFICGHEPSHLANTIIKLLDDADLRKKMGKAGRTLIDRDYNSKVITKRMVSAYEKAIEIRRGTPIG